MLKAKKEWDVQYQQQLRQSVKKRRRNGRAAGAGKRERDMKERMRVTQQLVVLLNVGTSEYYIVQELCESRGGRPGLSVLTSLLVSVDVKNY